jgi:two-component system response regulator CpxR
MRPHPIIMIVDFNVTRRSILSLVLTVRDYDVLQAATAAEALKLLGEHSGDPVRVVLFDSLLPNKAKLLEGMKNLHCEVRTLGLGYKEQKTTGVANMFLPRGCCTVGVIAERVKILCPQKTGPKRCVNVEKTEDKVA